MKNQMDNLIEKIIHIIKIKRSAMKLYNEKINNPSSNVSSRCCNFKLLEEKGRLYNRVEDNT